MTVKWIGGRRAMGGVSAQAFGPMDQAAQRLMSDKDHWIPRMVGGGPVRSGVRVNEHTAMTLPAAFAAVRIIATAMAQVPLQLKQRQTIGGRTITRNATDNPLYDLVKSRPNERMTSFRLRQTGFGHAAGWGNGYIEIERKRNGEPVGLWPLLPDRTDPVLEGGNLWYRTNVQGEQIDIPSADVIHLAGFGWDGYKGYSPIQQAREAIGLGLAAEAFGAGFFGNDARSGGVLIHPGKLSDPAKSRVADDFQKQGGLENAHRVKVLEEGMKFVATTIPPEDAQFLGTQEFTVAQVARIWGVPLFLLHSHEKATSWGSGLEQQMIAFVTLTLAAWAESAEQELDHKLLTEKQRAEGYYFKFNLNALLRGDTATRMAMYKSMILEGWGTRNEVRILEDMNPEEGLDDFLQPQNTQTTDQADAQANASPAPTRKPQEEEPDDNDENP